MEKSAIHWFKVILNPHSIYDVWPLCVDFGPPPPPPPPLLHRQDCAGTRCRVRKRVTCDTAHEWMSTCEIKEWKPFFFSLSRLSKTHVKDSQWRPGARAVCGDQISTSCQSLNISRNAEDAAGGIFTSEQSHNFGILKQIWRLWRRQHHVCHQHLFCLCSSSRTSLDLILCFNSCY